MKKIKRSLKMVLFICLIILAVFGICMFGGIPMPLPLRREEASQNNIELLENRRKDPTEERDIFKN